MISVTLSQLKQDHDQHLVAKSQWREFFCPIDAKSAWKTRLWFEDGSAETRSMPLHDVRKCLQAALAECKIGGIEVYNIDAFQVLAGPLLADIQWKEHDNDR